MLEADNAVLRKNILYEIIILYAEHHASVVMGAGHEGIGILDVDSAA